jgi:hypothetical protein
VFLAHYLVAFAEGQFSEVGLFVQLIFQLLGVELGKGVPLLGDRFASAEIRINFLLAQRCAVSVAFELFSLTVSFFLNDFDGFFHFCDLGMLTNLKSTLLVSIFCSFWM